MGELKNFPKSRKIILLLGDIIIITVSYWLAVSLVLNRNVLVPRLDLYSGMLPVMIVVAVLLFNVNGLYSIGRKSFAEVILSILVSMASLVVIMMAFSFFIREFSYSRGQLLVSVIIQTLALTAWRRLMWRIERSIHGIRKIMLVGSEKECTHIYRRLLQQPQMNLEIGHICTDFENKDWQKAAEDVPCILICPHVQMKNKSRIIHYCYEHDKTPLLVPEL